MEKFDVIHKPSHYAEGRKYEPKDVIRDWGLNFNLGSAVKYISRAGRKDDILQDLNKAKQFIEFEIEAIEEERAALFDGRNAPEEVEILNKFSFDFSTSSQCMTDEDHNIFFIKAEEDWANRVLKEKGYLTLAQILDELGFKSTKAQVPYGFTNGDWIRLEYDPEIEKLTIPNIRRLI